MRSRLRVTAALALAAALIGAAWWLGAAGCERGLGPLVSPRSAAATPAGREVPPAARAGPTPLRDAAGAIAPSARQPIPAPYCGPVRVHGCVQSGGRTAALAEVAFERIVGDRGRGVADWDLTDGDGGYEVRLRAARYGVRHEEHQGWIAIVEIPPGRRELRLDFEVPAR